MNFVFVPYIANSCLVFVTLNAKFLVCSDTLWQIPLLLGVLRIKTHCAGSTRNSEAGLNTSSFYKKGSPAAGNKD